MFSKVFFGPYLALLDARDAASGVVHTDEGTEIEGAAGARQTGQLDLTKLRAEVEQATTELHAEAAEFRNRHMKSAQQKSQGELDSATQNAGEVVATANSQVEAVQNEIRTALDAQKNDIVALIESKLAAA